MITVNVKDCNFKIDNDSGTYQPRLTELIANNLALAFLESDVGAAPTKVFDPRGSSFPTNFPKEDTMMDGCVLQQSGDGD